jgi:hypothetical protein
MSMIRFSELRKDRSRYDNGRKRSGYPRTADTNMYRPILAIDGEGITDRDGSHRYVMLCASDGSYIADHRLTTDACFEYLLGLPKRHLIVGFSISYDVCKWLQDMPHATLERLWSQGGCIWKGYSIRWAPGKQIIIKSRGRSVHIYDVFGYFQRSFVDSLREWKVGTEAEVSSILAMKNSRSDFSNESVQEMLSYCLSECNLLVQLVGALREAIIEGDIPMKQWYGAGAIAAAIMEKEGVKRYMGRPDENGKPTPPPKRYEHPIMASYFGGRFEIAESGLHEKIWTYDIRSAYPYILSQLPCLTHMVYKESEGYSESEWAIYYCEWSVDRKTPWPPFPFRDRHGQICYPYEGSGWYHASEVRSALALFPGCITIRRSVTLDPACPSGCTGKPFAFIPGYFEYRKVLKARGSQAQLTVKLGLNSLYGKTAQGVGWGEQKPPYQSYLWAGMITAGTRAMLLDTIRQNPAAIIWTAADGISSRERLNLNVGEELGEWEEAYADWVFCVQPGIYQVCKDGTVEIRSRGFGKREVDFEAMKAAYFADPILGKYDYNVTRFVGLGAALMRKEFWKYFGKWVPMQRTVMFMPAKRIPEPFLTVRDAVDIWQLNVVPPIRMLPPPPPADQPESHPFKSRTAWTDMWSDDDDGFSHVVDAEQP